MLGVIPRHHMVLAERLRHRWRLAASRSGMAKIEIQFHKI
jgi:hypothetical protein